MLYNSWPTLDLHGMDRDYAKILINEFVNDNYIQKNYNIIIIHGNGTGIIKKVTQETLKHNKFVKSYKIDNFNSGSTIAELKRKNDV